MLRNSRSFACATALLLVSNIAFAIPPDCDEGLTLPPEHYLQHSPQYMPPDLTFPLQREVDAMTRENTSLPAQIRNLGKQIRNSSFSRWFSSMVSKK